MQGQGSGFKYPGRSSSRLYYFCGNFYLEQLKAKAFVKQVDVKGVMR